MRTAKQIFDLHIKYLRKTAAQAAGREKKEIHFADILRLALGTLEPIALAEAFQDSSKCEAILVERYRSQFFEWLADTAIRSTPTESEIDEMVKQKAKNMISQAAKENADKRHNRPGGSREKQAEIRAAWASGRYDNRDLCAEQECAAIGMSFSSARRALRNTPDPA